MHTRPKSRLEQLPNEILEPILAYLPPRDLLNLARAAESLKFVTLSLPCWNSIQGSQAHVKPEKRLALPVIVDCIAHFPDLRAAASDLNKLLQRMNSWQSKHKGKCARKVAVNWPRSAKRLLNQPNPRSPTSLVACHSVRQISTINYCNTITDITGEFKRRKHTACLLNLKPPTSNFAQKSCQLALADTMHDALTHALRYAKEYDSGIEPQFLNTLGALLQAGAPIALPNANNQSLLDRIIDAKVPWYNAIKTLVAAGIAPKHEHLIVIYHGNNTQNLKDALFNECTFEANFAISKQFWTPMNILERSTAP